MPSLPDEFHPAPSAGGGERRQSYRQTNSVHANINRPPMTAPPVPAPQPQPTPNHLDVLHQTPTQPTIYSGESLAKASLFEVRAQQAHIHNLQQQINQMEHNFRSMDHRINEENKNTKTQLDTILSILQNQQQNNNPPSVESTQASAAHSGSTPQDNAHLQTQPTTHINVGGSVGNESDLSFGTATPASKQDQQKPPTENPYLSQEGNADLKTILQHLSSAHQKELKLPTLAAKKQKFKEWYHETLNKMQAHPLFTNFIKRENGTRYVDESLPQRRREELFNALTTALTSDTKTAIDFADHLHSMNGIDILNRLQVEYGLKCKHPEDADELMDELKGLKRNPTETIKSYHTRFMHKWDECAANQVLIWHSVAQAIPTYLGNMNHPELLVKVLLNIAMHTDDGNEWLAHSTLAEVRDRVERLIAVNAKINTKFGTGKAKDKDQSTKKQQTSKSVSAPDKQEIINTIRTRRTEVTTKIKEAMNDTQAITAILNTYAKKCDHGCWLHNDSKTHKFITCMAVEKICRETNNSATLKKAQNPTRARKAKSQLQDIDKARKEAKAAKEQAEKELEEIKALKSKIKEQLQIQMDEEEEEDELEIYSSESDPEHEDDYNTDKTKSTVTDYSPNRILAKISKVHPASSTSTIIIDSGCTRTMDPDKSKFEYITPIRDAQGRKYLVEQSDGSHITVEGIGPKVEKIQGKTIRVMSLYVPHLSCALFSILQHMQYKGCYFHAEAEKSYLAFPTFILNIQTKPEMQITATSVKTNKIDFDETKAIKHHHRPFAARVARADNGITIKPSPKDHNVFIKLNSPQATIPTRATPGSVGYDVTSVETVKIQHGETVKISTGISCMTPAGTYIRIAPRSSLSKKGLTVEGGVIDNDYRGDIGVLIHNQTSTHKPMVIRAGQRIAQFIFETNSLPCLLTTDFLPDTERGQGGFGSTESPSISKNQSSRRLAHPITQGVRHPTNPANQVSASEWQSTPLMQKHNKELIPNPTNTTHQGPRIRPTERVNNTTAKHLRKTQDNIAQAIGFLKPDKLIKNISTLGNGTVSISGLTRNPKVDPGETASIRKAKRNLQHKSKVPKTFSEIWHMDIGYGPCTGIGGYRYCLLLVDKYSRYKYVYGLKNLTTSITKAINQFLTDVKIKPQVIRTDFDPKLMGGKVKQIFISKGITVECAPPHRQDENGLCERQWQTLVTMTRNWLTSSLLPSKYWFAGIKRAAEVSNILPVEHTDQITTPYELVYQQKPDYRTLIPMFSLAYIRRDRAQGGHHLNKWHTRTIRCILIGTDDKSDGLLFYHPPSRQTLTANDGFKFDTFLPSGPQLGETFDGAFIFNTKTSMAQIHRPPTHEEGRTVWIQQDNDTYIQATVLSPPIDEENDLYQVQETESGDILEIHENKVKDHNPLAEIEEPQPEPHKSTFGLLPWIRPNAKVTLYLPNTMETPKQGRLTYKDNEWYFMPGRSNPENSKVKRSPKHQKVHLPNFTELAQSMVNNKKLFQGWRSTATVLTARKARAMSNIIARHVSAKDLHIKQAPSLKKHKLLHPDDKKTWDAAYNEEYDGLLRLNTWEVISEQEYKSLIKITGKALPTMAISTIKPDEKGNPKRCKYRIVVLGNHDPNNWTQADCFAPVLSQPELRLLLSLATKKKRIPKCGDVSQAFCQGILPPNENYILRPPPGCPRTPKNAYLRLKRTLYGLKRSPRHWYEKAVQLLKALNIHKVSNSNCIFKGTPIPGQPPIYLGLYVDDFIFFSESDEVEKYFQQKFGEKVKTTFESQVDHFLGLTFHCKRHSDNNISIRLSQEPFIENLLERTQMDGPEVYTVPTPYRSGYPVDKIPCTTESETTQKRITHKMQKALGSLQWLATSTRPDIATITNILSQYTHKASKGHLDAVKRVIRYLKGTKNLGIAFHSNKNNSIESFVKFPVDPNATTPFTDANWGPQDQSNTSTHSELELFKSRSISGYIIWTNGPLHWMSKRQTVTARSSAEAEIYATDECVKHILYLRNLLNELELGKEYLNNPLTIYNDNAACVAWSHNMTTKGLRYIQIRENAVREAVQNKIVTIKHIGGKDNISDLFTKEDKDTAHFTAIRNILVEPFHTLA